MMHKLISFLRVALRHAVASFVTVVSLIAVVLDHKSSLSSVGMSPIAIGLLAISLLVGCHLLITAVEKFFEFEDNLMH